MIDEAADTLRFFVDPDATSFYDIRPIPSRRPIARPIVRAARQVVARLREALASGWDVGPELAYEERRLAALEASS